MTWQLWWPPRTLASLSLSSPSIPGIPASIAESAAACQYRAFGSGSRSGTNAVSDARCGGTLSSAPIQSIAAARSSGDMAFNVRARSSGDIMARAAARSSGLMAASAAARSSGLMAERVAARSSGESSASALAFSSGLMAANAAARSCGTRGHVATSVAESEPGGGRFRWA